MKKLITFMIFGLAMLFCSSIGYADPSVKEKSVYEKVVSLNTVVIAPVAIVADNLLTQEGSVIDVGKFSKTSCIIFNSFNSETKFTDSTVKCKFNDSVGLAATILVYSFKRYPDFYSKHPHSEVKYTLSKANALPYNCSYRQCWHSAKTYTI